MSKLTNIVAAAATLSALSSPVFAAGAIGGHPGINPGPHISTFGGGGRNGAFGRNGGIGRNGFDRRGRNYFGTLGYGYGGYDGYGAAGYGGQAETGGYGYPVPAYPVPYYGMFGYHAHPVIYRIEPERTSYQTIRRGRPGIEDWPRVQKLTP